MDVDSWKLEIFETYVCVNWSSNFSEDIQRLSFQNQKRETPIPSYFREVFDFAYAWVGTFVSSYSGNAPIRMGAFSLSYLPTVSRKSFKKCPVRVSLFLSVRKEP